MSLSTRPKDDRVRYYLGAAYVEKESLDQAIAELKKIPPESDLYADARRSIVLILSKQKKIDEAVRLMEESIQAKPKDADLYIILAALFEKENQLEKACGHASEGLSSRIRTMPTFISSSGALFDKQGNFEKMVAEMKEVLRLNPNHADALNYLGYSYAERGIHLEEALTLVQKAMDLKPNAGYITDSLGWVYYKLGRLRKGSDGTGKGEPIDSG